MLIAKELRIMAIILLEEFVTTSSNTKYKKLRTCFRNIVKICRPHASSGSQSICTSKFTMKWMHQDVISFFSQTISGGLFLLIIIHFILFRYIHFLSQYIKALNDYITYCQSKKINTLLYWHWQVWNAPWKDRWVNLDRINWI